LVLGRSVLSWEITHGDGGTHLLAVQPTAARVLIPTRAQRQMYEQTPDLDRRRRLERLVLLPLHLGYDSSSPGEYGCRTHLQPSCARGLREAHLRPKRARRRIIRGRRWSKSFIAHHGVDCPSQSAWHFSPVGAASELVGQTTSHYRVQYCDAGVTQNPPTLSKLTSLTVRAGSDSIT
jgi:hypothetical protein